MRRSKCQQFIDNNARSPHFANSAAGGFSRISARFHASPTIVAGLAGVVRVVCPGTNLDLGPGEVLLIAPGIWHTHEPLRAGAVRFGQGFLAAWSDVIWGNCDHSWSGRVPSQPSRHLVDTAIARLDPSKRKTAFLALLSQVLAESVAQTAARCGFSSAATFPRAWKREYRTSPPGQPRPAALRVIQHRI